MIDFVELKPGEIYIPTSSVVSSQPVGNVVPSQSYYTAPHPGVSGARATIGLGPTMTHEIAGIDTALPYDVLLRTANPMARQTATVAHKILEKHQAADGIVYLLEEMSPADVAQFTARVGRNISDIH